MATVDVINTQGDKVGTIDLADQVFAAPVREHLLWEVVVAQRAAARAGSAHTKVRSEVRGSTRKIYRQKGTGRARHGSIRAPIFVGGGVAFGPKHRSYAQRTSKKVKRGALISALSLRNSENQMLVFDSLQPEQIKTKAMGELLARLGLKSGLFVDELDNLRLVKSVRNLANAKYLAPGGVNVQDVLRHQTLLISKESVKKLEERLSR